MVIYRTESTGYMIIDLGGGIFSEVTYQVYDYTLSHVIA